MFGTIFPFLTFKIFITIVIMVEAKRIAQIIIGVGLLVVVVFYYRSN